MLRALVLLLLLASVHAPTALSQVAPELRRPEQRRPIAADCKSADGGEVEVKPIFVQALSEAEVATAPVFVKAGRRPPPETREGRRGTVRLAFVIDTAGVVIPCTVSVIHTDHRALVYSAYVVIRTGQYRPAFNEGHPVAVRAQQTVVFR